MLKIDQFMNIAEKIRELRKEKSWSQDDLGKAVGVHQRYVSTWETGKNMPAAETLIKLSRAFAVSVDYLLFENVPREGVSSIDDFDLYDQFRQASTLPQKQKDAIKELVSGLVFRYKVKTAEQEAETDQAAARAAKGGRLKIAGKR